MTGLRGVLRGVPLLALLAACTATPREAVPAAPLQALAGAADPTRQAVLSAAYVFAEPSRVAGRPADAARAVAQLEWLAVALPADSRWIPATPMLFPRLLDARAGVRRSLGLAPAAPATATVPALMAAAAALDAGDRAGAAAALAPVSVGGGEGVLARLDPLLAQGAGGATSLAQEEMLRMGRDDPD
jgi:hypothetical protein